MPCGGVEAGALERWGCGDYIDGCWFGGCPVKLTADFHNGIGTVEFAGTVNHAFFKIKGLERRWDWCLTVCLPGPPRPTAQRAPPRNVTRRAKAT